MMTAASDVEREDNLVEPLTPREREILAYMAEHRSNQEIAEAMMLSLNTVKWYARQIYAKLNVKNRKQAVAFVGRLEALRPSIPPVTAPHNLPAQLTTFIGREAELAELAGYLADPACRLVSIVGPGGIGKTRLSLAVAREQVSRGGFADGVFFVTLVPLTAAEQITTAIAEALNLPLESSAAAHRRSALRQLQDYLAPKCLLLVLDNLEHLLAGAGLINDLLQVAPSVKVLVTSRERPGLAGEQLFPILGLPYDHETTEMGAAPSSAVRLFIERAQHRQPDFRPEAAALEAITHICRLVEGVPLALELAAAWIDTLSVAEIGNELQQSLDLLTSDSRSMPERHRSMHAVFDAAWQRLAPSEQQAFAVLSVFRGGFTREAADHVAGLSIHMLSTLVAKSLIQFRPAESRYQMHELMRHFGHGRLAQQPDQHQAAHERHCAFYCTMLAQNAAALTGEGQQAALLVLSGEAGNLRAAWQWAVDHRYLARLADAMDALEYFYEWTGRYAEGLAAFEALASALATTQATPAQRTRVRALAWCGLFGHLNGSREPPRQRLEDALDLLKAMRSAGHDVGDEYAFVLRQKGRLLLAVDISAAIDALQSGITLLLARGHPWEIAVTMAWLGQTYRVAGHLDQAVVTLRAALARLGAVKDRRTRAMALEELSQCLRAQGQVEEALALATESLALRREIGDRPGIASSLINLHMAHEWVGRRQIGIAHVIEALAIYRDLGNGEGICRSLHCMSAYHLHLGEYDKALATVAEAMDLARHVGNERWLGALSWMQGTVLLGLNDDTQACSVLQDAIAILEKAHILHTLGWAHTERAFSAWRLGERSLARGHVAAALRIAIDVRDASSIRYALSAAAFLLPADQAERAVELFTLALQDPVMATSRHFRHRWERALDEVTAAMSAAQVAAVTARGRTLDLYETATQTLAEVELAIQREQATQA